MQQNSPLETVPKRPRDVGLKLAHKTEVLSDCFLKIHQPRACLLGRNISEAPANADCFFVRLCYNSSAAFPDDQGKRTFWRRARKARLL